MTKADLLKALEPYADDANVSIFDYNVDDEGNVVQLDIIEVYEWLADDGDSIVAICVDSSPDLEIEHDSDDEPEYLD